MIEMICGQHTPVCDYCGDSLGGCKNFDEARKLMRDAHWKTEKTDYGWENICPACQRGEDPEERRRQERMEEAKKRVRVKDLPW